MEIAGYHLLEPLSQSGPTINYLARHENTGSRRYIIKRLKEEFAADQEVADAFMVQAKLGQQLHHPGFVEIFDSGKRDSSPYCVMAHTPGLSLEEKRGEMCLLDKIYMVKHVARNLQYIANFGRVHGNINPANILIHPRDSRVLLAECGFTEAMAYRITYPESSFARLTRSYISPEQAGFRELDPRSDLYSLGVVLLTLLMGNPPEWGPKAGASHVDSMALDDNKRAFQPFLAKALSIDPADRYQSADEFVAALEMISDDDILRADGVVVESKPSRTNVVQLAPRLNQEFPGYESTKTNSTGELRKAGDQFAQLLMDKGSTQVSPPAKSAGSNSVRKPVRSIGRTDINTKTRVDSKVNSRKRVGESGTKVTAQTGKRVDKKAVARPGSVSAKPRYTGVERRRPTASSKPSQSIRKPGKTRRSISVMLAMIVLVTVAGAYTARDHEPIASMSRDVLEHPLAVALATQLGDTLNFVSNQSGKLADSAWAALKTFELPGAFSGAADQVSSAGGDTNEADLEAQVGAKSVQADAPRQHTLAQEQQLARLLAQAEKQLSAGRLLAPAEKSAYVYFQQALALDSSNQRARQGIANIASQQYAFALEHQRRGDYPGAMALARSSHAIVPDSAKLDLVRELEVQERERQSLFNAAVAQLLAVAERRVIEGKLLRPTMDNAVVAYRKVLELDPDNGIAHAELDKIKMSVLQEVEAKLDRGSLNSADALITRIGIFFHTAGPELEALSERLLQLRNAPPPAIDRVITQARAEQSI